MENRNKKCFLVVVGWLVLFCSFFSPVVEESFKGS